MSGEKCIPRWITIVASLMTISVPVLYIFGYAYDQGRLEVYGISTQFFPRSIQEYLVFAFFACLNIVSSMLKVFSERQYVLFKLAGIIAFFVLLALIAYRHRFSRSSERARNLVLRIKGHWLFDYISISTMVAFFTYVIPFFLIISIAMILLLPGIAYFTGRSAAMEEIKNTKTCVCTNTTAQTENCVYLLENGKPLASGRFIARSATHLALFNQGKVSIYPVKDQIVEVIPQKKN